MAFRILDLPSKKVLRSLYLKDGLSTYKIAKRYDCDPKTIYQYLRLYKIQTRPRKRVFIAESKLRFLYAQKKLPLSAIAGLYNCCPVAILNKMKKYGIPRRSTSEACTKHSRKSFSGNLKEKAYLLGFRTGDLRVRRDDFLIAVGCGTTKQDQIDLINSLLSPYGPGWLSKKDKAGRWHIDYTLDRSFKFLLRKHKDIPRWIFTNRNLFLSFLAGYIDAEGNIGIYTKRARLRIGSYDYGILRDIHWKLFEFDIDNRFSLEMKAGIDKGGAKHNGDFWRVKISKMASLKILLPLLKPLLRHRKRLNDLLNAERNISARLKTTT